MGLQIAGADFGSPAHLSVNTSSATQICDFNMDRKFIIIESHPNNLGEIILRGSSGSSLSYGIAIAPGEKIKIESKSAFYAYHQNGVTETIRYTEVHQILRTSIYTS